jgi:hypothetical protein
MLLPVPQVSLAAEDNADTSRTEADTKLPSVTASMLFKPLLKSRIILAHSFQFKGAGHILLLHTLGHLPTLLGFLLRQLRVGGVLVVVRIDRVA